MGAFEAFVRDNPALAERPYGETMAATLRKAFPCNAQGTLGNYSRDGAAEKSPALAGGSHGPHHSRGLRWFLWSERLFGHIDNDLFA